MEDQPEIRLIMHHWSDKDAEYVYKLERLIGDQYETIATGDVKWAKRIAAHYDLEVPTELESVKKLKIRGVKHE